MSWMDEIAGLTGPAVTMVAPRMVRTPGTNLDGRTIAPLLA